MTALLWIFPVWHQLPSICDDQTTLLSPFPADEARPVMNSLGLCTLVPPCVFATVRGVSRRIAAT